MSSLKSNEKREKRMSHQNFTLEQIVPDVSHITAKCRVGFKKRGEQIPTDFVEVELNDSIGKLNVTGSNFIDFRLKEEKNYEEQPPAKRSAFDVMMAASLIMS